MPPTGHPRTGARVLVADDDPAIRLVLRHRLEAAGYSVSEAADGRTALEALRRGDYETALVDIIMPGIGGLDLLSAARKERLPTAVIVITAASTMSNAIEAMKRGAHDYLTKPFSNLDTVVTSVANAIATRASMPAEVTGITVDISGGEIIGRSAAMQEVYKLIGRVANSDASVLLLGESGTGKELVARAIHFNSERCREPFVAVNCSAIPPGLLESELFGHERGAFTGALDRKAGKFEQAGIGTIFLDEIGDLPLELQPKLLRTLQEREFTRVGGPELMRLRARVIAATNQDLETAVAHKRFREDLYFRLRVFPIHLPALRDRREDITELTSYFIAKGAREMGTGVRSISPEARAVLASHDWPGNVRELENAVLRAALLAAGQTIRPEDIAPGRPAARASINPDGMGLEQTVAALIHDHIAELNDDQMANLYKSMLAKFEKPLIEAVLERAQGNQLRAARQLGLNRNTLHKKISDLRIVIRKGAID
ncbi:MAG: sigma-54-dependent Fis family transcriptional regulator [Candidatus Binataceae bacterium]|nr:sigma-54-dependent Fis family transcriptional regulator [Candidatus Binataceae bacterium]